MGNLCISFDFEMYWAFIGERAYDSYKANMLGKRKAIPRILELFERYDIHASWATVGLIMCEDGEELEGYRPKKMPSYLANAISPYKYLSSKKTQSRLKSDAEFKKCHFAPDLVRTILDCPNQELATHTFSHYYCNEPGQTIDEFDADIEAAKKIALNKFGVDIKSIIFPRHQTNKQCLDVCFKHGIKCYRGNQKSWLFNDVDSQKDSLIKKTLRYADNFFNLTGSNISHIYTRKNNLINIPASFFLRPYDKRFALLNCFRLQRIKNAMKNAANTDHVCHLWLHPHNYGVDIEENLTFLNEIFEYYTQLNKESGFKSLNMKELADEHEQTGIAW
ncbi:MAG: polysaccharide deacetylase family protein [Negativicutes bacterium]|jgi:peptidoglycan/xylan/chitin deacetylase (PgdA/CDA1 family)